MKSYLALQHIRLIEVWPRYESKGGNGLWIKLINEWFFINAQTMKQNFAHILLLCAILDQNRKTQLWPDQWRSGKWRCRNQQLQMNYRASVVTTFTKLDKPIWIIFESSLQKKRSVLNQFVKARMLNRMRSLSYNVFLWLKCIRRNKRVHF